jgi:hypothetical protein
MFRHESLSSFKTAVLVELEKTNQERDHIGILNLCNSNQHFGGPGTPRRRAVQKYIARLKGDLSIEQYAETLTEHGVQLSKTTEKLLAMSSRQTRSSRPQSIGSIYSDDDLSETELLPIMMATPNRRTSNRTTPRTTSNRTTPNRTPTNRTTHDRATHNQHQPIISPTRALVNSFDEMKVSRNSGAASRPSEYIIPHPELETKGTVNDPHVFHADVESMELNGGYGFEVTLVNDVKHENKVHPVIYVTIPCMPGDHKKYKAETTANVPAEYKDRALLISVPSVNVISQNYEMSAVKFDGATCTASMNERQKRLRAIRVNNDRHRIYYLMLTPEGFILDNSVFCPGKKADIKRWTHNVFPENKDQNFFGKNQKVSAHFVSWRIALCGGEVVEEADDDDSYDSY